MTRTRKAPVAGRLPQILLATALLGAFAATSAAAAEVVPPGAGLTATLGDVNVSVYYQPAAAGYETVVTAGTDAPGGVVRFVSTLAPGQEAVVAVPRGTGQPALELRLLRVGDRLELQRPVS
ncbi:hypothetical protein [Inquilinus limosus]|uniref:Uncharacterized protein n=1 Tax=Inquilinus limosus TaxID=171674 RepID=A0A211ZFB5_9PROT|nr:hypothetical protein [Inquilinus limosus]OWJ63961.1 hypothetical protein BWR60_27165 [Inquilinus limosus]